ncbi:hypothetical protein OROGR_014751 [Orobanche gracilis]
MTTKSSSVEEVLVKLHHGGKFVEDKEYVGERDCSCRWWELSRIPSCHALSCILHRRGDVENYVDSFYKRSTLSECYKHGIPPLPSFLNWPKLDQPPILPPQFSKMPGRPKKNRNRSANEVADVPGPKLSYKGMKMSCRNCGSFEHNRRTCKAPPKQVDAAPFVESVKPPPPPNTRHTQASSKNATARRPTQPNATETRSLSSKSKTKDQRAARKRINTFVSPESGNIFFKSFGTSRVRYVSGARVGVALQPPPQASNEGVGSQASQVIDATAPGQ